MNSNVDLGSGGFNGVPATSRAAFVPVRYKILALLFVLSFVNYFLRNNLSKKSVTVSW